MEATQALVDAAVQDKVQAIDKELQENNAQSQIEFVSGLGRHGNLTGLVPVDPIPRIRIETFRWLFDVGMSKLGTNRATSVRSVRPRASRLSPEKAEIDMGTF